MNDLVCHAGLLDFLERVADAVGWMNFLEPLAGAVGWMKKLKPKLLQTLVCFSFLSLL